MDERGRRTGLGSGLIGNVAELGAGTQEQLEAARPSPRMSSPLPLQHSAGAAVGSQQAPNNCPSKGSAAQGPEIAATRDTEHPPHGRGKGPLSELTWRRGTAVASPQIQENTLGLSQDEGNLEPQAMGCPHIWKQQVM